MDDDTTVGGRGKGDRAEAEPRLESKCDRQAEEEGERERETGREGGRRGRAGVGEMRAESKPPSSPDFSVKDTVLKR